MSKFLEATLFLLSAANVLLILVIYFREIQAVCLYLIEVFKTLNNFKK